MKNRICLAVSILIIAAMVVIQSSCSDGKSASTLEVITLKGIPFDTPNLADAVMNLCLTPSKRYTTEQLKSSETWCKFNKEGRISIPAFSYGNLPDILSHAVVNSEGSLVEFEFYEPKEDLLALASLLSSKYGKPTVTKTQIENKLGQKFDQEIFVWVDQRGTRITIHSIYDRIDSGKMIIESASIVKAREAEQALQNKEAKNNL